MHKETKTEFLEPHSYLNNLSCCHRVRTNKAPLVLSVQQNSVLTPFYMTCALKQGKTTKNANLRSVFIIQVFTKMCTYDNSTRPVTIIKKLQICIIYYYLVFFF